jgi:hypothetical protein
MEDSSSSSEISDQLKPHDIALMASSFRDDDLREILRGIILQQSSNSNEGIEDEYWKLALARVNHLASDLSNSFGERFVKLKDFDPRLGYFNNHESFKRCFLKSRLKVSELYELSTFSFTFYGLDDELYETYICPGSMEDHLTFYCWLHWKDYFMDCEWLLDLRPDVPRPTKMSLMKRACLESAHQSSSLSL